MPDMGRRLRRLSAARIAVYRQLNDLRPEEIDAIFETIDYLETENAALKARLVVDDAMIGRAEEALCESARYDPDVSTFTMVRRLLEAALGKEPNA